MKRHNLLRALAAAGILAGAAGALAHTLGLSALTQHVTVVTSVLASIWNVVRLDMEHLTATQLAQAAAGTWLIFVALLVLLARSRTKESSPGDTHPDPPNDATLSERPSTSQPPIAHEVPNMEMPPLPIRSLPASQPASQPPDQPPALDDSSEAAQPARSIDSTPRRAQPHPAVAQGIAGESQSAQEDWRSHSDGLQPIQGHTVALTGVIEARDRLLSYGLFVVAEDIGVPTGAGGASQRTVNTIIEHMAPVLTGSLALGRAQRAGLLNVAVLHAILGLREEYIQMALEVDVGVTAALVIDSVAQVASVGTCRAYLYRMGNGLTQITADQLRMSGLAGDREYGSPDQDMLYTQQQPDSAGSYRSTSRLPSEVEASEVRTQPEDLVLLTSPKLWQAVQKAKVEALLRAAPNARVAARSLAYEAASQPEDQDFGVIVIRPREGWMPGFGIAVARPGTL